MDARHSLIYFGICVFFIGRLHASDTEVTDIVSFDITIGGEDAGTIEIGLFGRTTPLTVQNFLQLSTGGVHDGMKIMRYEGTLFHRIIEDFMVQGGDVVNNDGTGEVSIYGDKFDDENFQLNHYGAGWLSMANAGPDTNTCQFFITARATAWLDGKHVVFGKVLHGMPVVRRMLLVQVTKHNNNKPTEDIVIAKCSAKKPKEIFTVTKTAADWST